MTILRINAETFVVKGFKEELGKQTNELTLALMLIYAIFISEFDDINLLVNIGGYLGLFIGLSLNDLFGYIIDALVFTASNREWFSLSFIKYK